MTRCLGLVGGLGVGATTLYYRELVKAHHGHLPLVMVHADMDRVLKHAAAGEKVPLAKYLAELIGRMQASGAQVAVVPAITPHLCIQELIELSPLPIINVLESIADAIQVRKIKRVALFGTRFTITGRMFGCLGGVEIVDPQPEEIDYIHEIYFQIASSGAGSDAQRRGLTQIAQRLCAEQGAEAIVLAGTDLSTVFDETNTNFPYIDCAQVHMQAILRALVDH